MEPFRLDDLVIDPVAGTATRDVEPVALSDLSVRVLVALAEAFPEPLDRDALAEKAWGQAHVSEQTLMQRITMIRRELGDDRARPRYVRTVRGKGYALAVSPDQLPAHTGDAPPPPRRRWRRLVVGFLLFLALLAAALYATRQATIEPVLYDARRQSLRIDGHGATFLPPIRAEAAGHDLLIVGLPEQEEVLVHPEARNILCALARGEGIYTTSPPEELRDWLAELTSSCPSN